MAITYEIDESTTGCDLIRCGGSTDGHLCSTESITIDDENLAGNFVLGFDTSASDGSDCPLCKVFADVQTDPIDPLVVNDLKNNLRR